jgi:hypothetical protein
VRKNWSTGSIQNRRTYVYFYYVRHSRNEAEKKKNIKLKIYRERRTQKKIRYRNPERKALVIQQVMSLNRIFKCGLSSYTIFFLIVSYTVRFPKKH